MSDPFDTIPDTYVQYYPYNLDAYLELLDTCGTGRLKEDSYKLNVPLKCIKIATADIWYYLATLKVVLGRERFNTGVGVWYWDVALTMVDCVYLSDTEVMQALWTLKQLLIAYGFDPQRNPHTDAYKIKCIFKDIWNLRNDGFLDFREVPTWDEVTDIVFKYA